MKSILPGASNKSSDALIFSGDDIVNLRVSPQLVRWGDLDTAHVEFLARDIALNGQQSAVTVRKGADGRAELVAGRHRHAAVLLLNSEPSKYKLENPVSLIAIYRNISDEQVIRASFAENTGKPLTCMDLCLAAAKLANTGKLAHKQIAAIITTPHHKISASRVSQLLALAKLPQSIQLALHEGRLPESAARAILSLGLDDKGMQDIANEFEEGELTAGEIISLANEGRREKGKKVKRTLNDVRRVLDGIGTSKAMDFLSWLEGEFRDDSVLESIFGEEDDENEDEVEDEK